MAEDSRSTIETRSIDFIPVEERHGRVRDQFTFWFAANMEILNVVFGGIAVFLGLDFFWACLAITLGTSLGLVLVCFHAIQGPQLGVPQMIQSRGQFGFYGAVWFFVVSIVLDFGFLAAQLVVQGEALNLLVSSISIPVWIAIATVPVAVLAIFGYDWLHRWQRWLAVVLGVAFVVIFVQALIFGGLSAPASGFKAPSIGTFMAAVSLFVMVMLSWGVYISDYSRYLPATVDPRKTVVSVFLGNAIPTIFCAALGAYLAGLLPQGPSTVSAVAHVSGDWALVIVALSLFGADAINAYTGMLALASVVSCFKDIRGSISMRVGGTLLLVAASLICGVLGYESFVNNISDFLNVLLFLFIPWSAINLTDFYLIKHGQYDVPSFFTPTGIYGGWLWRGIIPYVLAVLAEVPFVNQTLYKGPLVDTLGGVDVSWIVGGVSAVLFYWIAMRIGTDRRVGVLAGPDAELVGAVEGEGGP